MDVILYWILLSLVSWTCGLRDIEFLALKYSGLNIREKRLVYKIIGSAVPNHQYGPFYEEDDSSEKRELSALPRRMKIPKEPIPNEV